MRQEKSNRDCLQCLKSLWALFATILGKVTDNHNLKWCGSTVLSWASAHGRSQLKCQNLGVGGYTRYEVGSHGAESTCIVGSFVFRQGQPDSGEGCIMLQSGPTHSLIAKFLQRSVVGCSTRISCWKKRCEPSHRQVCANLMLWHPKRIRAMWAQQTYLQIHYARISMVGGYTENLEKLQNCQKWGVGACSGQYGTCSLQVNAHTL